MAKTNAERQAAYRERRRYDANWTDDPGQGCRRLDLFLSQASHRQLQRLARFQGGTQRDVLERLLAEAEAAAVREIDPRCHGLRGNAALRDYFGFDQGDLGGNGDEPSSTAGPSGQP